MKPIFIVELANFEYLDAIKYYNLESEELELAFKIEIRNVLNVISRFPGIGDNISKGIKKMLVSRFPYQIFYKEYADKVVVFSISHQHREPYYWTDRVNL